MVKLSAPVCIESPVAQVWARLAQLEDIQLWSDAVVRAHCAAGRAHGVGAERTCELAGNRIITERWVAWDEGKSFQYEGFGLPLIKRAINRWSVLPQGDRSLLTSEAELEFKGGIFGQLLGLVMAPVMKWMAPGALARFKYLVEQGKPYTGKSAKLPRPPALC